MAEVTQFLSCFITMTTPVIKTNHDLKHKNNLREKFVASVNLFPHAEFLTLTTGVNRIMYYSVSDAGILGKKKSESSYQESNLRPSDY